MAGLISPPLFIEGEFVMRRMKVLLAVVAAMTMLMMMSVPAMADDFGRNCFPFCNDHHNDFDHHDDDFFINDFDNDFAELDDCEIVGWDGDQALVVCELDF
jgi:hypothetical protein